MSITLTQKSETPTKVFSFNYDVEDYASNSFLSPSSGFYPQFQSDLSAPCGLVCFPILFSYFSFSFGFFLLKFVLFAGSSCKC